MFSALLSLFSQRHPPPPQPPELLSERDDPKTPEIEASCAACWFFDQHGDKPRGDCRRFPSVATKQSTDWCGEFRADKS